MGSSLPLMENTRWTIKDESPDLMTLDIRMPGIDGYEVMKKAKTIAATMPIIISAIDVPDMEESLKSKGAAAVFTKPADLKQLLESIRKLTKGREGK